MPVPAPRRVRIVQAILIAQAVIALLFALGMATGTVPPADQEPVNGRKVAAFAGAFAITLVLVAASVGAGRRWLLVPMAVTGVNLADTLYEFGLRGDANYLAPMVIEPVFLALYVASYLWLAPPAPGPAGTRVVAPRTAPR